MKTSTATCATALMVLLMLAFCAPAGAQTHAAWPGNYTYSVAADWANRPVNWVSWADAAGYCNWLTNGQASGDQTAGTIEDGTYALNGAITDAELIGVVHKNFAAGALYCLLIAGGVKGKRCKGA